MTLLKVDRFSGISPQVAPDLLPAGKARVAQNVRLSSGSLSPLKDTTAVGVTLSGPQVNSIYRFGQSLTSTTQYWFQSTLGADWAKGPIDNDTVERTYWTDGVFPKKTDSTIATAGTPYPSASFAMGLPAPANTPTIVVSGVATNPADPIETTVVTYTYVSTWGEEGPPSVASLTASWQPGQTLTIGNLSVAPGAGVNGENYSIVSKRVYRSATGTNSTQYQLVTDVGTAGTIPVATVSVASTQATASLGEVLPTIGWLAPPPTMIGLKAGPNGMMAGFYGNTICFCEPNFPYAWPVRYQQSTDAPIVGIEWFDQTLAVFTTQGIYTFTGADPANLSMQKLGVQQSCTSRKAIVAMHGGVIFTSPDGLYKLEAGGISALTDGAFTRTQWQTYNPSTMIAFESDNRYILFHTGGTAGSGGLLFEFGAVPSISSTTLYAYAGYRDRKADQLFLVNGSNELITFDTGSDLTYTWTSGIFHLPHGINLAAGFVDCTGAVTLTVYDSHTAALLHTQVITSQVPFRLPAVVAGNSKTLRIQFTLIGTGNVREVKLATAMQELGLG